MNTSITSLFIDRVHNLSLIVNIQLRKHVVQAELLNIFLCILHQVLQQTLTLEHFRNFDCILEILGSDIWRENSLQTLFQSENHVLVTQP